MSGDPIASASFGLAGPQSEFSCPGDGQENFLVLGYVHTLPIQTEDIAFFYN